MTGSSATPPSFADRSAEVVRDLTVGDLTLEMLDPLETRPFQHIGVETVGPHLVAQRLGSPTHRPLRGGIGEAIGELVAVDSIVSEIVKGRVGEGDRAPDDVGHDLGDVTDEVVLSRSADVERLVRARLPAERPVARRTLGRCLRCGREVATKCRRS